MRYRDIRRYLKPYSMVSSRTTTINHAFAASIAPNDNYDEEKIRGALIVLGQDPESELRCGYCDSAAETWDHIHATVKAKKFSGYGHRIANLLPCCKPCNSKKGNKDWRGFLDTLGLSAPLLSIRTSRIEAHLAQCCNSDAVPEHLPEYQQLQEIRDQVIALLRKADGLAKIVREKSTGAQIG